MIAVSLLVQQVGQMFQTLHEDLETVKHIIRRKRKVKSFLKESEDWCCPGLWYIEGPYARHWRASLPDSLQDAVRGIWKRGQARQVVERIFPPWHTYLRNEAKGVHRKTCSIAYLSNGGNWKLFDLENEMVRTRVRNVDRM